ncbi:MAG TPA: hypothetical protein VIS07_13260 [Candidatus Binatia bacterium]
MRRVDRTLLLASAAYAVAVTLLSWPLVTTASTSVVDPVRLGQRGAPWVRADLDLLIWILAWTSHAIVTRPLSLFQANIFYPAPDTLAASEHLIGLTPIATPLFLLTDNAVLTYNVTLLVVIWLAATCTFALARAWSGSAAAAFVAGAAFAFAPHVVGAWLRLHESAVALFPLVMLLAWRAARAPRRATLAALFVVTLLQVLAGMYVAYELLALVAAFAPALVVEARRSGRSPLPVLATLGLAFLAIVPVGIPYLRLRAVGTLPPFEEALGLVAQNSIGLRYALQFVGEDLTWPVVALALVGLVWPSRTQLVERLGLLLVALVGVVLSAGLAVPLVPGTSLPSPYEILMRVVPGFASLRAPSRFLVLPLLAVSVLAALGLARIVALAGAQVWGRRALHALFLAGGVALVAVRMPEEPLPFARIELEGPQMRAHRWLRDEGTPGPVLRLPVYNALLDIRELRRTGLDMIGSTLHWYPLLNGYSGYPPPGARLLMTLAQRLPDPRALDELCRLVDVRWIVLHLPQLPEQEEEVWQERAPDLGLTFVARVANDAIFRVDRECGVDPRLAHPARGAPTETFGGVPLAPLDPRDRRGTLILDDAPEELLANSHHWFWLDVTNEGTATWPGLSPAENDTVALQARWREASSGRLLRVEEPVPLARDLSPGETMRAQVDALAPVPGEYVLELGLVQRGRGWFADEGGSGILRLPVRVRPVPQPAKARHADHDGERDDEDDASAR